MEIELLKDFAVIFGLAIVVLSVCHQLRLPPLIGYLLTGVICGPHGLLLVGDVHKVELLAEIGVVFLLFAIGLEFSFKELARLKNAVLIGGTLQVALTIGASLGIFSGFGGLPGNHGLFIGFLLALSSTAIVLKLLQEKGQMDTPHGQTTLAILIYQDIVVVLMMLLTPLLGGIGQDMSLNLLIPMAKGLALIGFVIGATLYLVPRILYHVAATRNRELFLLAVFAICLFIAWMTSIAGLSLGLGAFLAGLIISESEYGTAALGNITPFRDVFMSFFFVSVGMLFDLGYLLQNPLTVGLFTLLAVLLKGSIAGISIFLLGLSLRTVILSSLALSQVGEFSFVLAKVGKSHGFLAGDTYQLFLAVTILTMACTPALITLAAKLTTWFLSLPLPERIKTGFAPIGVKGPEAVPQALANHLVIIGFGLNGKHLSHAARMAKIPYIIIETNPETVRRERAKGEPIIYGDATHVAVLEHAHIGTARVAVVAISDPTAIRRITQVVKQLQPTIFLVVRTRFVLEMEPLIKMGADEVIPEEFETAVEIFTRVLHHYLVPQQQIDRFVNEIRSGGYQMFRSVPRSLATICEDGPCVDETEIKVLQVEPGSVMDGATIGGLGLRKNYGVTLLAIRRDKETITNPVAETRMHAHDDLILFGPGDKVLAMTELVTSRKDGES